MELWDSFLFILDNIYKWLNIIFVRDLRYNFMGVELLLTGFVQSLEFLKKCWNFAQQFSRPRKSLENGDKVWKEIKSLVVFQEKELKWFFFPFGKIFVAHHKKKNLPAFFKVYIDHLFDNLESGIRNYCFGKKVWKKSSILEPKICTKPVLNFGAKFQR